MSSWISLTKSIPIFARWLFSNHTSHIKLLHTHKIAIAKDCSPVMTYYTFKVCVKTCRFLGFQMTIRIVVFSTMKPCSPVVGYLHIAYIFSHQIPSKVLPPTYQIAWCQPRPSHVSKLVSMS